MADFYLDKSFFGTPFYLYFNDDGKMSKETDLSFIPESAICINSHEAEEISKLYGFEIPNFPPKKYLKFFQKQKLSKENVPWEMVLPKTIYRQEVERIISHLKESLCGLDISYYQNYFKKQNDIFKEIQPAKINVNKITKLLTSHSDTTGHLRSFMPKKGYARKPVYSRTDTVTGRLKIESGPMILNISKQFRNVLESRFKGGSIWQLDYSSLEPRILLSLNHYKKELAEDVYQGAIDDFNLEGVPRKAIKEAVLSRIYGAADNTIIKQLKGIVPYPEDILGLVDEYFGVDKLRQKIVSELAINDGSFIENYYGRRVSCEGAQQYVLINYFIQSTGVDVALFGFNEIIKRLKTAELLDKIVPIFILHDALYLDVHPSYEFVIPKLCKAGSKNIPKFEHVDFCLKAKKEV